MVLSLRSRPVVCVVAQAATAASQPASTTRLLVTLASPSSANRCTIASANASRPLRLVALNGMICSSSSCNVRASYCTCSGDFACTETLSIFVTTTIVGTPISARKSSIWRSSSVGSRRTSSSCTTPRNAAEPRRYPSISGLHSALSVLETLRIRTPGDQPVRTDHLP